MTIQTSSIFRMFVFRKPGLSTFFNIITQASPLGDASLTLPVPQLLLQEAEQPSSKPTCTGSVLIGALHFSAHLSLAWLASPCKTFVPPVPKMLFGDRIQSLVNE